jgi:hypothetical protein
MKHDLVCCLQKGGVVVSHFRSLFVCLSLMLPTADLCFVLKSDDTPAITYIQ